MQRIGLIHLLLLLVQWGVSQGAFHDPACFGDRTVIVHLFMWRWDDIADECERFLGPKGFCGVQVSPPNEHRVVREPVNRPWWEVYQPVSYILESRMGDRNAFINMVERCNNVGVQIYPDAVINHMTGWDAEGFGTAGSYFNALQMSFPDYSPDDFNCCDCPQRCDSWDCEINNWHNPNEVRNCRLLGLLDLDLGKNYVRDRLTAFMNDLIDIGVAGFRVDACKHMWPQGDMETIWNGLNTLNTRWWPSGTDPFIFQEVIDKGGEPIRAEEYFFLGQVTEFQMCDQIADVFRGGQPLANLVWWPWSEFIDDPYAFIFVDNHDNQRSHGGGGEVLNYKESRLYKAATAFELAHPYGFTRIMSSFDFPEGAFDQGPPSNGDDIANVPINPDGTCGGGWICEHRWRQITNMVRFRNLAGNHRRDEWWDNGGNQIAFSRWDQGFIAINLESWDMNEWIPTTMPDGVYCDIISGDKEGSSCTGQQVVVSGGFADVNIASWAEDAMIAIHSESRL